jgi:hypothetical protein
MAGGKSKEVIQYAGAEFHISEGEFKVLHAGPCRSMQKKFRGFLKK